MFRYVSSTWYFEHNMQTAHKETWPHAIMITSLTEWIPRCCSSGYVPNDQTLQLVHPKEAVTVSGMSLWLSSDWFINAKTTNLTLDVWRISGYLLWYLHYTTTIHHHTTIDSKRKSRMGSTWQIKQPKLWTDKNTPGVSQKRQIHNGFIIHH
jgi:hypothetical protein